MDEPKTREKFFVFVGTLSGMSTLGLIWVGCYLSTILPAWTRFPMVITATVIILVLGGYSICSFEIAIDEIKKRKKT